MVQPTHWPHRCTRVAQEGGGVEAQGLGGGLQSTQTRRPGHDLLEERVRPRDEVRVVLGYRRVVPSLVGDACEGSGQRSLDQRVPAGVGRLDRKPEMQLRRRAGDDGVGVVTEAPGRVALVV